MQDARQAAENDPSDPEHLFDYAYLMKDSNPAEYQRVLLEVVQKFPDDESAAKALYFLAQQAPTPSEKVHYLEMLREKFPTEEFNWSSTGLAELFKVYDQNAPQKALLLANEESKAMPKDED